MIGLRRALGLFVSVAAISTSTWAFAPAALAYAPDELSDTFSSAIELLQRGKKDEALVQLKKVVAMSPDQKAAYELWKSRDYADWRDLLIQGGDFELAARRLIDLARVERKAQQNDKDAILALVKTATTSDDPAARRQAARTLAADHGAYAVPALLVLLSDGGGEERRILAMHALSQMGHDAAVPVAEALKSDNATLRRNAAYVLGNLGSAHAVAALQHTAASDADPVVKQAAADSLVRLKAQGSALTNFLAAGDAYWRRSDTAFQRGEAGDVVWDWKDGQLVGTPIPRALYGSEMSKRAYYDALRVDPNSTTALAGLARAYVDGQTRIDAMTAAGQDAGAWKDSVGSTLIAVNGAGVDALDLALASAVQAGDAATAAALCRVLGPLAPAPTSGLRSALAAKDGAMRSEAAVALANVAARSGSSAGADVVQALGDSAGREVLRLALVVDADAVRANALAEALRGMGTYAAVADNGALGLVVMRRSPALDIVFVADSLTDITTAQIVDEVKGNERTANVPVFVLTNDKDKDAVAAAYGERIAGTSSGAADLEGAKPALTTELSGDRALATTLAARSAEALAHLGAADDLGPALAGLASATAREDATAVPAMAALGARGTDAQAPALLAALVDDKRSEGARAAAGSALARIVSRSSTALDAAGVAQVEAVVRSDASMAIREAAARILGSLSITPADRAKLLEKLRG
ncbi:MAG: HEAT repeat domain-containing protein [Planctomycetota bacterium]|nr:HEAT repeat domain-containing protein [Planctomycetota bacterium]